MMEAFCTECKETFIPHSEKPDDLIHGEREDGEFCGGLGQIVGAWVYTKELEGPKLNSQERIENVAFEGLIRKYTERRDFEMVAAINSFYFRILHDREGGK